MEKYIDEVIADFENTIGKEILSLTIDGETLPLPAMQQPIKDFIREALKEQERRIKEDIAGKIRELKRPYNKENHEHGASDGFCENCAAHDFNSGLVASLSLLTPLPSKE